MADRNAAVERQLTNPAFLLKGLHLAIKGVFLLALCVGLLTAKEFYDSTRPDRTRFFASSPTLSPYPMVAMDQPMVDELSVVRFAESCVDKAYSMDFFHYRKQSQEARGCFEAHAWNSWGQSFLETKNLERLKMSKLVTSIQPMQAATVRQRQVINGRLTWDIQFPAKLTWENVNGTRSEDRLIKVRVRRSDDPAHLQFGGIAISLLSDPPWMGDPDARVARR